jgi:hypothetical protein
VKSPINSDRGLVKQDHITREVENSDPQTSFGLAPSLLPRSDFDGFRHGLFIIKVIYVCMYVL